MNNTEERTQPIIQYPTDLIFSVLDYDISDQLSVLSSFELDCNDYRVDFAIIGESHCITISHCDTIVLQEVLACMDIPAILQAQSHKFVKLDTYQYKQKNYLSRIWFSHQFQSRLWQHDGKLHLDFPKMFDEVPFTEISWRVDDKQIAWQTIHVYPLAADTTYVYSESLFTLNERSNNE